MDDRTRTLERTAEAEGTWRAWEAVYAARSRLDPDTCPVCQRRPVELRPEGKNFGGEGYCRPCFKWALAGGIGPSGPDRNVLLQGPIHQTVQVETNEELRRRRAGQDIGRVPLVRDRVIVYRFGQHDWAGRESDSLDLIATWLRRVRLQATQRQLGPHGCWETNWVKEYIEGVFDA